MTARGMPAGYRFLADPNAVATVVLGKSTWAVLALTCQIEIFVQAHYRESIDREQRIDPLFKDVFRYPWMEEAQHGTLDEMEWEREDARLTDAQRDRAVDELIELVAAVDGILQMQSRADADYFMSARGSTPGDEQRRRVQETVLKAYRWQYIVSGVRHPRFAGKLASLASDAQLHRIEAALKPIVGA